MEQKDNIRVLVTGGSGFIGTNLIEDFINKDYIVCNVDIVEPKIATRKKIWIQTLAKKFRNSQWYALFSE